MFENSSPNAFIKIIDFGLAVRYRNDGKPLKKTVGTISTMSPQVLEGHYSSQCDLWSIGVIAFTLLSGENPFTHKATSLNQVLKKIIRCQYNFDRRSVLGFSVKSCRDFISSLIVYNPELRLTADEALKHEWLNVDTVETEKSIAFQNEVNENLISYANCSEIKKLGLLLIAHKSKFEDIIGLRKVFLRYDPGNTGYITLEEFKTALDPDKLSDDEFKQVFKRIDTDKTGKISYTEFLAATIELHENIEEDRIWDAFEQIDSDNTGFISKENLRDLLGKDYTEERVNRMFEELNLECKCDKISFVEFSKAFRNDYDMELNLSMVEEKQKD